ncbi:MAG: hypothetical protein JWL93_874 [Hyphomicrobiales bacterium]|jgi:hypothetical protein|nr:hypothetical protein [Hyphomicrobiales bacterium]
MIRTISFLGAATALAMGAFAIAGPQGGSVEAREESHAGSCVRQEVALDEGYGVSRIEIREICSR